MSNLKQTEIDGNAPAMNADKFDGLLLGLLIGSYICELRAGNRASDNAMAIMKYRTTASMMIQQGKPLPSWGV